MSEAILTRRGGGGYRKGDVIEVDMLEPVYGTLASPYDYSLSKAIGTADFFPHVNNTVRNIRNSDNTKAVIGAGGICVVDKNGKTTAFSSLGIIRLLCYGRDGYVYHCSDSGTGSSRTIVVTKIAETGETIWKTSKYIGIIGEYYDVVTDCKNNLVVVLHQGASSQCMMTTFNMITGAFVRNPVTSYLNKICIAYDYDNNFLYGLSLGYEFKVAMDGTLIAEKALTNSTSTVDLRGGVYTNGCIFAYPNGLGAPVRHTIGSGYLYDVAGIYYVDGIWPASNGLITFSYGSQLTVMTAVGQEKVFSGNTPFTGEYLPFEDGAKASIAISYSGVSTAYYISRADELSGYKVKEVVK